MKPVRIAGAPRQHARIRELVDELEWERRKGVITALLPYSGDRPRPRRFPVIPEGVIPLQRKPTTGEKRVARAVQVGLDARYLYVLRNADANTNRNPRI